MPIDKASAVEAVDMLSGLPTSIKKRIISSSGVQHFGKNALLFCEGESAHFVHGIVSGTLALFTTVAGEETVIGFFGPGELLLIPPALLDLPYMLSARATTDGVALLIPANEFRTLMHSEVSVAEVCAKLLARHWRILVAHMKQITMHDAKARLVRYIIDQAGTSSGQARLILPGLKKELATHLGITPETLSRTLRSLRKYGVEATGQIVNVRSLSNLVRFITPGNRNTPLPHANVRLQKKANKESAS